jgi:hypothetical protein
VACGAAGAIRPESRSASAVPCEPGFFDWLSAAAMAAPLCERIMRLPACTIRAKSQPE